MFPFSRVHLLLRKFDREKKWAKPIPDLIQRHIWAFSGRDDDDSVRDFGDEGSGENYQSKRSKEKSLASQGGDSSPIQNPLIILHMSFTMVIPWKCGLN